MAGPELLVEWRRQKGHTQKNAADLIGISQASLCDYENEKAVPRIDTASRIETATDGFVPVSSWLKAEGSAAE